jgi:hypothetical protein
MEGSCEHGNDLLGSLNSVKLLSSCTIGGLSRRAKFHAVNLLVQKSEHTSFHIQIFLHFRMKDLFRKEF